VTESVSKSIPVSWLQTILVIIAMLGASGTAIGVLYSTKQAVIEDNRANVERVADKLQGEIDRISAQTSVNSLDISIEKTDRANDHDTLNNLAAALVKLSDAVSAQTTALGQIQQLVKDMNASTPYEAKRGR